MNSPKTENYMYTPATLQYHVDALFKQEGTCNKFETAT